MLMVMVMVIVCAVLGIVTLGLGHTYDLENACFIISVFELCYVIVNIKVLEMYTNVCIQFLVGDFI